MERKKEFEGTNCKRFVGAESSSSAGCHFLEQAEYWLGGIERYLRRCVGEIVRIAETEDIVYIGATFPDKYKGVKYTKRLRGLMRKRKQKQTRHRGFWK